MNALTAIALNWAANAAIGVAGDKTIDVVEDHVGFRNWKTSLIVFVVGGSVMLLSREVTRLIMDDRSW